MRQFLLILISVLTFSMSTDVSAQLVMGVSIQNESDDAGTYFFDIFFERDAASASPIYFHNGDMVVLFNTNSFTNPVLSKVDNPNPPSSGPPFNLVAQNGFNDFVSTTYPTDDFSAAFFVQKPYYDKQSPTSDFVGDGELIINFDPINVDNTTAHNDQIAVIDGIPFSFGRYAVTGYNGGGADLAIKFPAPGPPPAANGDAQLSPLASSAFSIDPVTFQSMPVALVGAVLPVRLIDFAANKYNRSSSMLIWQTVTEQNASHFMIERSERGTEAWETVGKVDAAGNSTSVETYEFIDRGAYDGLRARVEFLYRLKIVDNDDSFEYSNIEAVTFTSASSGSGEVTVFPNPVKDVLHIQIADNIEARPSDIVIYDVLGKLVYTKQIADDADYTYINMYEAGMEAGTYLVQFVNNDMMISQEQVIVQR